MHGFIAVHLGAGRHSESLLQDYRKLCKKACLRGSAILRSGRSAVDAAVQATVMLENSALTNAGFGSNLTSVGTVECDAGVMEGEEMQWGAVGAVSDIDNPILVAHRLCVEQKLGLLPLGRVRPCILVGPGAAEWAKDVGIQRDSPKCLISEKALRQYSHYQKRLERLERLKGRTNINAKIDGETEVASGGGLITRLDTVGVVCMDGEGRVAATSSSGGIALKQPGRVGQAAVFGAGCWATDGLQTSSSSVATSTSGCGELLIRASLARECAQQVSRSSCSVTALRDAMTSSFTESPLVCGPGTSDALGGVLVLRYDSQEGLGEILWAHTTPTMYVGYLDLEEGKPKSKISRLPPSGVAGQSVVVEGTTFTRSLGQKHSTEQNGC